MPKAEVNGIRLNYERTGGGIPVVLITGLMGETGFWAKTLPLLEPSCDVITVDNRGAGSTEYEGEFTVGDMADDISCLLDHLGMPSAHVLGWSMGSHIAIALAARHPSKVRSLTLASAYLERPARSEYILDLMSRWYLDGEISEEAVGAFMNVLLRTEGFFRSAKDTGRPIRSMRLSSKEGMMLQLKAGDSYNPSADAERIECPVMYIHGEEDIMVDRDEGERLAKAVHADSVVSIPGDGHLLRPQLYIPCFLDFIKGAEENPYH